MKTRRHVPRIKSADLSAVSGGVKPLIMDSPVIAYPDPDTDQFQGVFRGNMSIVTNDGTLENSRGLIQGTYHHADGRESRGGMQWVDQAPPPPSFLWPEPPPPAPAPDQWRLRSELHQFNEDGSEVHGEFSIRPFNHDGYADLRFQARGTVSEGGTELGDFSRSGFFSEVGDQGMVVSAQDAQVPPPVDVASATPNIASPPVTSLYDNLDDFSGHGGSADEDEALAALSDAPPTFTQEEVEGDTPPI